MSSTEKDLVEKFKNKLFSLIEKDSKVIVAFSGGCDSLGLLALCSKTVSKGNLHAVYVNHNIRSFSELESETELNCFNCDSLNVPLTIREIPRFAVKDYARENNCGTEAAARVLRYELLESERKNLGFDFILTAHHFDDQIETVLMKKMQDSPITSLRGISEKNNCIVRPLLDFSKNELKEYVTSLGLSWSTDSTNKDNSLLRNKIRNEIIPKLKEDNSNFEKEIEELRNKAVIECNGFSFEPCNSVSLDFFNGLSLSQKYLCLFSMWDYVVKTYRGLSKSLVQRVIINCNDYELKGSKIAESGGGCFETYNSRLYLSSTLERIAYSNYEVNLTELIKTIPKGKIELLAGKTVLIGENAPEKKLSTDLILDTSLFYGKTVLRYVRQNDRIELKDSSKTVLRLLQDLKVPSSLRMQVPVIADEKGICAVFASAFGSRNRIARRFCDIPGSRFVLLNS